MIPILDRFEHGSTSNAERMERGQILRRLILKCSIKHGVFAVFKRLLFYPFGAHMLETIPTITDSEFTQNVIRIKSPMDRHNSGRRVPYVVPILNPFKDVSIAAFRKFRRASTDQIYLKERIKWELGIATNWSFKDICEALEAILALRHPQLLISIFNFTKDAAQPTTINLGVHPLEYPVSGNRSKLEHDYSLCWQLIRTRTFARHEHDRLWVPTAEDFARATSHDRVVTRACLDYLNAVPERGLPRPDLISVERYLYAFPYAYESLTSGRRLQYVGDVQAHAIRTFGKLLSFPEADIQFLSKKDPRRQRLLAFTNPLLIEFQYGLDQAHPAVTDTVMAAMRVTLIIMFNAGRRARCLVDVQIKHFEVWGDIVDLIIPSTKVPRGNWQRVPLSKLLSNSDMTFLLAWLAYLRGNGGISESAYLFDLLGITREEDLETDVARTRMVQLFSAMLGKRGLAISTHLLRHTFISWFYVRALLAHYPSLRNHPVLKDCLGHWWLSEKGLAAFRHLVPSKVSSASCALLPIVGHFLPTESRRSYGRAWALLAELRASLLERETRLEISDL